MPFGGGFPEENLEPIIKKLKAVVDFGRQAEEIRWAKETRPMWEAVYAFLSEGKPGLIGALTARAEAYVTRLACIYALLDSSTEINPIHLKAAIAIWDYCEASVKYIFQDSTGDPLATEILEALINHPQGMTRTDIYNYFQKNKSSERIQKALDVLESLGKAKKEDIPTEGRSREVWFFA